MATMTRRTVTTVRHEYLIPKPANWAEVSKAMNAATQDMKAAGEDPKWDDAAWFEADDENIILYWEEHTT